MRVLVMHDESIVGGYGAEAYVRRLVGGLRAARDEVDVIAGEIRHTGVGRVKDVWDPAARKLVAQRAERFRPDVIHFHNIARELSASVLRAAPDIPAVMTVHDFRLLGAHEHSAFSPRGRMERLVSRAVRKAAADRVVATTGVSERVSNALRRNGFPNVTTVRVPVTEPAKTPTDITKCGDVAVVARLSRDKGVDVAIEAFRLATQSDTTSRRLLIAGDGPEREQLEAQARRLGERVKFLGRLDEPAVSGLLGRVRAVIVASQPQHRPEGSSLVLVEAAMHGRAAIVSDDPAVREVSDELGSALEVETAAPAAFANELRRLLDDDALAAELGERGRRNADRLHSVDVVSAATRAVYRDVVGTHR
jgi:glycosyltransferase involved in cell wall biosynthesis